MCPHATIYPVSSYYSSGSLLVYVCPRSGALHTRRKPHTTLYLASSYHSMWQLTRTYVCPRGGALHTRRKPCTTLYLASSYYYTCFTTIHVFSYYCIPSLLILVYMWQLTSIYVCSRTRIYVRSLLVYMCDSLLVHMCDSLLVYMCDSLLVCICALAAVRYTRDESFAMHRGTWCPFNSQVRYAPRHMYSS